MSMLYLDVCICLHLNRHGIINLHLLAIPVYKIFQDIQSRLEVGRMRRGKEPIVRLEFFCNPLNHTPETLRSRLLPGEHHNPVPYHIIHHHVKYGGGDWIPLGYPLVAVELGTVIASRSGHHEDVLPILPEDPLCYKSKSIADEDIQASLPIQGIVEVL